jgi:hypothetical protein
MAKLSELRRQKSIKLELDGIKTRIRQFTTAQTGDGLSSRKSTVKLDGADTGELLLKSFDTSSGSGILCQLPERRNIL